MKSFKKYYSEYISKINEDALVKDDEAAPSGLSPSSDAATPSNDVLSKDAAKPDGALSDQDVLGKCDHMHGDGVLGPGCYHIPTMVNLSSHITLPSKKKPNFANDPEMKVLETGN